MDDNYGKILGEGYGLRFYGGNRTRTGFVCKTDAGLRELKNASPKKDAVQFEHDVKEHLYTRGFRHISRFCLSNDGKPYFQLDQNIYVLERSAEGQPMEEDTADTFLQGATELAKLHKAGRGVVSSVKRSNLRQLPLLCSKRKNELLRIKKRIDRQKGYGALDVLVLQNFAYYMECIEEAEKLFQSKDYEGVMKEAEENRTVCHNTYKGENIRKTEKGQIYVTGFQKCAYDSPMSDLSAYLRRCIKKSDSLQKGISTAVHMVEAYYKTQSFTQGDMDALLGSLLYPEKFLRLINEYYNKRQVCVSPAMRERLNLSIDAQRKMDALITEMKRNFSH